MTLNVNEPTDQTIMSELASYIRENRAVINGVFGSGNMGFTDLTISAGTTTLIVGTDVGDYGFEIVKCTGAASVTISKILGGSEGQVKVFIFQNANVDFTDGNAKSDGKFYLHQLPAGGNFDAQEDDILALVNIGGDGAANHGYWQELYRSISIK